MIPNEVIEQIRDYDIVSILQDEGLTLKREGANYKCCCPFHNEKTPSFVVSPARNIAHCFGCNETWDAIGFVRRKNAMTFYEAVEYLAAKLHIQYEKREPSPEEREAQYHREQLMAVNADAQEYFLAAFKRAPVADDYCKRRGWSQEIVSLFGVGYAPGAGGLCNYLLKKGWKKDVIMDAGLASMNESGEMYDSFRERIVFPIWAKTGYIAGFTGRYIGNNEDVAKRIKYVNTKENALFQKRDQLFGWFQAARQVSTNGTVVLCEGNPDVMRLHQIGVGYAVAPMGTALTQENIEFLRKKATNVIIAGDMDKSGIEATRKHGEELLRAGLRVRVMTWQYLPGSQPPDPKDPDEYFAKNPKGWDEALSRNTEDYLPWIAAAAMRGKQTQTEVAAAIVEVCRLLAMVRDETAVEMYLTSFAKAYKNQKIWRSEYYKAKNALDRRKASEDESAREMIKEYGFYIKDHCYYGAASSSNDRCWSNFILEPILHIRDERNARRIYRVVNIAGQEAVVKFQQSDLVSFADFKRILESAGNYIWKAKAEELTQLKTYLYDDTPSADEIRQLGWQKRWGFYAWGNGGMDGPAFAKASTYGVFKMRDRRFYLPGCAADTAVNTTGYVTERRFVYLETNDITLREYLDLYLTVYGDNAKIAFCFLVATLFKDIMVRAEKFPILFLFGPKGTGKTQFASSLTAWFYTEYKAPSLEGSTKAAIAEALAEVSNAIVHFDEYKVGLGVDKQEILKGIWDGVGRTRVNIDNDKRREQTAVDCGVVVSGQEQPTADIALFSRVLYLTFRKSVFSAEEKQNMDALTRIEKRGLTHLTAKILELRSVFQGGYRDAWDATLADFYEQVRSFSVEDRALKNWACILAAFRTLEGRLDVPFSYKDLLPLFVRMCVGQNAEVRQGSEIAAFWETVENLVGSSRAWIDADYKISTGGRNLATKESRKAGTEVSLSASKRYIFINFNRLAALYQKEGGADRKPLPKSSLRYYLENSSEYIGTVPSMKFKLIDNAMGYTPSDPSQTKTRVTTAMAFDYDAIVDRFGVNLDVSVGYHDELAPEDPAEPAVAADPEIGDLPFFGQ
ncbi:MAG: DNA primase [Bacteroidales bacterium]|nr:DNA primase [Bacteroidales bacterium]